MRNLSKILALFALSVAAVLTVSAGEGAGAESARHPDIRWRKTRIPIAFSTSFLRPGTSIRPDSDIQGAVRRSLEAWEAVADVQFELTWTDKVAVSPAGKAGDGVSLVTIAPVVENLLMFGGDETDSSARSRVFFNRRKEISEADIVFNPYQQFSTDGSFGTYDFEAILTHELGHLLGLDHSELPGSTMFERQAKNGTFSLAAIGPRTLGEDDIVKLRGIYGNSSDSKCCGTLEGKITPAGLKEPEEFFTWLEDAETGRVATGGRLAADGSFRFRGLHAGKYRLFGQDTAGGFSGVEIGDVTIAAGRITGFSKRLELVSREFFVRQTGFNGQLIDVAIPVNRGKSYLIYAAGEDVDKDELQVTSTAPGIDVKTLGKPALEFGATISVITFEAAPSAAIPPGEYTVVVRGLGGDVQYLPSRLTVEMFSNPWVATPFDQAGNR